MSGDKCATCGMGVKFVPGVDGSARRLVHDDAEATDVCAPAAPVVPGTGERVGCLQHHEVDCDRCGKLDARHRLNIEPYAERPARVLGGCVIGMFLFVFMGICILSAGLAAVRLFESP